MACFGRLANIRDYVWIDQKRKIVTELPEAHADSFWQSIEQISLGDH